MFSQFTLGLWTFQTFSVLLALAIAAALLMLAVRGRDRTGHWADAGIAALVGGVLGARIFHVVLHWNYFAENLGEVLRLNAGGLDWHGAVVGGIAGLYLAARWRRLPFRALLDRLTPALPLLALAGWVGCFAALCGYGAEVDTLARYSALAVSESRDIFGIIAPRYNTQLFGVALALLLLLFTALLWWRGWLVYRRFWLVLALLSAGMFVIGFYRGDAVPILAGLRVDQWLDAVLVVISLQQSAFSKDKEPSAISQPL